MQALRFLVVLSLLTASASFTAHAEVGEGQEMVKAAARRLGRTVRYSNSFKLYTDALAYAPFLKAIREAKDTVDIHTYLWCDDEVGLTFAQTLADLADRKNVRVRVLIDSFNTEKHDQAYAILYRARIPVLRYNRIADHSLNKHVHEKVTVVDGRKVLAGGANFCNEYFIWPSQARPGREGKKLPLWHDFVAEMDGPLAYDYQRFFDQNWDAESLFQCDKDAFMNVSMDADFFNAYASPRRRTCWPAPQGPTPTEYSDLSGRRPLFDADAPVGLAMWSRPYRRKEDREGFSAAYTEMMDSAQREIVVYTPYFIPYGALKDKLLQMASKVKVRIFTNSPAHNDLGVDSSNAALLQYPEFFAAGAEIYELQTRGQHGKAIMIDGQVLMVGSNNLTTRSMKHNGEQMLATDDGMVLEAFQAIVKKDMATEYKRVTPATYQRPSGAVRRFIARALGGLL